MAGRGGGGGGVYGVILRGCFGDNMGGGGGAGRDADALCQLRTRGHLHTNISRNIAEPFMIYVPHP